ncbi:hypothetical protein ABW636_02120 [Aquimarina sp. 2201CG1-2-11]|uniref:ATP-grasp domain-containing protein n=1 Tax=Aquimarina discodermiae TaxID=3231043 RepID=UPI003462C007
MPRCAFLSITNTEGWFIDDNLVHEPLKKLGWEVFNVPWNIETDWNTYDLVIIRSTWDYQSNLEQFSEVLKEINDSKAILLNNIELVMWNINKNYLFEIENNGIELVQTIIKPHLEKSDIEDAFDKFNSNELIIKPTISANADDTFRIVKGDFNSFEKLLSVFEDRECMIQPFMQNVVEEGEYSLIYFNGELSHTILKTVGAGDYRVQEEHGGGVTTIETPEKMLVSSADKVIH